MKRIMIVMCLLTGCTASFNPWPGVTESEFKAAIQQLAQNDQMLAQKIAEMVKGKEDENK